MSKYDKVDLSRIKTYSIKDRISKVNLNNLASVYKRGSSFDRFWDSLPDVLAATDIKNLIDGILHAFHQAKPVVIMMGAHVIKCGLSPILIDLMERKVITGIALNGAGVIHDAEMAYWGETSEDVAEGLTDGRFGMARETADIINLTISHGKKQNLGFGEALGEKMVRENPPYKNFSLLARGYELNIPVTVHVALGTDVLHQHPSADGAAIGDLSLRDFKIFCHQITQIGDGGVVLNIGSTVILPEVFLKALTVARNLGHSVENFITANFDMIQHYRPRVNVVQRPTLSGGKGYQFTGHHEIMIPLLAAGIVEKLESP